MTSTFTLRLDTTAPTSPTFAIAAGAAYVTNRLTTADFTSPDADTTQVKIWGAGIDVAYNASIQATEGASSWITYATSVAIQLTTGDGSKSVSAKIRDDVGNETSTLTDTVTLDTTLPTVSITVPFTTTTLAADLVYKISGVAGWDTAIGSFQSDSAAQAWKVKVVSTTGAVHSSGTQIGSTYGSTGVTGGSLAATTNQSVSINGRDLQVAAGVDGDYIVKVFAQDLAGNWSV